MKRFREWHRQNTRRSRSRTQFTQNSPSNWSSIKWVTWMHSVCSTRDNNKLSLQTYCFNSGLIYNDREQFMEIKTKVTVLIEKSHMTFTNLYAHISTNRNSRNCRKYENFQCNFYVLCYYINTWLSDAYYSKVISISYMSVYI